MSEERLKEKLKKLEALYDKTSFKGEQDVALDAIKRIKKQLHEYEQIEKLEQYRFTIYERWSRKLFIALCRKYSIEPYRYHGQKRTSLMINAPVSFIEKILWPQYQSLSKEIETHVNKITDKIIISEIYDDIGEIKELEMLH